jgi:hypothetical protein
MIPHYVQFQLKWKETIARGQFISEVATWGSAHEKCLLIIWLKVKENLPWCLIKYNAIKTYGRVKV